MTTDWTAFGEAHAEIPALFDHLRGKKKQARNYARNKLVELCGPAAGSTGPAAAVLPTLLDLLADPAVQEREGLLLVLADLAAGGLHPDALVPGYAPAGLAVELNALVAGRADALVPLLDDKKAAVRGAAALPLALVGRHAPIAARAAKEKNATAKGAMLVGLGLLGDRAACEAALSDGRAAVRFGAACGLLTLDGPLHEAAVAIVVEDILTGTGVPRSFPWCVGNTAGMGVNLLTGACLRRDDATPLERLFPKGSNPRLAAALLRVAWPERTNRLRDPARLTEGERGLLRVVSLSKTSVDATYFTLNNRGFPAHRASLARYAGATAPGPLDMRVGDRPLWLLLREALDGEREVASVWAAVPEDVDLRALVEDCCSGYMSLHLPFPRGAAGAQLTVARGQAGLARAVADLLVRRGEAASVVAWMEELLPVPGPGTLTLSEVLLRAWEALCRPDGDAIARFLPLWAHACGMAREDVLRPLIERVAPRLRDPLLLGIGPKCHFNRLDGDFCFDGCLPYLDLVQTAEAAAVAISVVREHMRPPLDRIQAILVGIGPVALPALERAIAEEWEEEDRLAALTSARAKILEH